MDARGAIHLIETLTIWGLDGMADCCGGFEVFGVAVYVNWKPGGVIRVHTEHLYPDTHGLEEVARLVARQVAGTGYPEVPVRFCCASYDNLPRRCCYCEKPRAGELAYLCDECSVKSDAILHFPWTPDWRPEWPASKDEHG